MSPSISKLDLYLFHEGSHFNSYKILGAHLTEEEGQKGVRFSVWAAKAKRVRVVGDFNQWQGHRHPLKRFKRSGIWSAFIPGVSEGHLYKFEIHTKDGHVFLKSDPYGFSTEFRPETASKVVSLPGYPWEDEVWQEEKKLWKSYNRPMLIYEVHLGSWKRHPDGSFYSFKRLADDLVTYVADMGYTHVEILPLTEHPLDGSWGYQATGYYAVTSRYGSPHDFMYFVDKCHQKGLGVILDWVPGHFCRDDHGLALFDGTPLYEYQDPVRADNAGWGTKNFDLGKPEVFSFLISNAVFWFDLYHIDGLRVDAVASMLYLDYGRQQGEWTPNVYGGRENLEAVGFLKRLNEVVFGYFPQALMMAEESTAWPMVSAPTYLGGLGFNYKWNMGWMNDTLRYFQEDPINRKWHHNLLTFSTTYCFSENFILPLSHDEVVHGKKSLLSKMPGDDWQKFAGLRLLYGYMLAHPGKKLLFMGGEFGQFDEWNEAKELDWGLLCHDMHQNLKHYVQRVNHYYLQEKSLWELDRDHKGFTWIEPDAREQSILIFIRRGEGGEEDFTLFVFNFTPVVYEGYRVGVPQEGSYQESFSSDRLEYGGTGRSNGVRQAEPLPWHNQPCSLSILVPPLAMVVFKKQ